MSAGTAARLEEQRADRYGSAPMSAAEFRRFLTAEDLEHSTAAVFPPVCGDRAGTYGGYLAHQEADQRRWKWCRCGAAGKAYKAGLRTARPGVCGTINGYNQHHRNGELPGLDDSCGCRLAARSYWAGWRLRRRGRTPQHARCGTAYGYQKHRRDGTLHLAGECGCRAANAAEERSRYQRRKQRLERT